MFALVSVLMLLLFFFLAGVTATSEIFPLVALFTTWKFEFLRLRCPCCVAKNPCSSTGVCMHVCSRVCVCVFVRVAPTPQLRDVQRRHELCRGDRPQHGREEYLHPGSRGRDRHGPSKLVEKNYGSSSGCGRGGGEDVGARNPLPCPFTQARLSIDPWFSHIFFVPIVCNFISFFTYNDINGFASPQTRI